MRTIDILTSQNVTINYELAELRDRIFAWILDMVVLSLGSALLLTLLPNILSSDALNYFYYLLIIPLYLCYFLLFEILMDGQTPGKRVLGIRVVKLTGSEPSPNDYFIRWAFRPIDITLTLGSIGIMMISSTDKGQRLGDIVANTTVIKVASTQIIRLEDLLNIRSMENYEPRYPQITRFSEQDMLLIKEVMDRYQKYPNDAQFEAMDETLAILRDKLDISEIPPDHAAFLRTLIKDYVALSR